MSLPWAELYRPRSLSGVLGHPRVTEAIANVGGHLLLWGPPGVGKTTVAWALARDLCGQNEAVISQHVREFNASHERGVAIVRDGIKHFAATSPQRIGQIKILILDEADGLTIPAQNALRRIMEIFVATTRFVLLCNQPSLVDDAIRSSGLEGTCAWPWVGCSNAPISVEQPA